MRRTYSQRPPEPLELGRTPAAGSVVAVEEVQDANELGDQPIRQRDRITLSARARRLLERIKPIVVNVLTFWDHGVTRLVLDDCILTVDESGSYQVS